MKHLLLPVLLLIAGAARAQGPIIDSATDDFGRASIEFKNSKGGPGHNLIDIVDSPVRAGRAAFRHRVDQMGERAELAMQRTEIGGTYWYGWSMLVPESFDPTGSFTIVMQMNTWPSPRDGRFPCGGNGHKIRIGSSGDLRFDLQRAGVGVDSECEKFLLGHVAELKGKWVDFVMHGKWTGDEDGFLRLWMKIGDGDYEQKIDYRGRTWWNDEDRGPYFKMGAYMGDPGWKGPPERVLYTDEYRLGDSTASFQDVAPGGGRLP